ncbi:hypothetical protein [Burkholderia gladioli]|uniref:hypothetical protein n=1 Tax=Burkholderia gladioli TaxID=28095 RepID=UPI00164032A2|nr:hypothetical protein [Burkholderia gladioli]MBU9644055.1 MbeD family mobilization/exclusion protein [Burkholderia gladioli]
MDFTSAQATISDAAIHDPLLAHFLSAILFSHPGDAIKKSARAVYGKFARPGKSAAWTCRHAGCTRASIWSHEISEGKITRCLARDIEGRRYVDVLAPDLSGNPYRYAFKHVATRSATTFLGYCQEHDNLLFRDLDNGLTRYDDTRLNAQYLRSLKKRAYETERQIAIWQDIAVELRQLDEASHAELAAASERVERNLAELRESLARWQRVYEQVRAGLEAGRPAVGSRYHQLAAPGYLFSGVADLSQPGDTEPVVVFLLKADFADESAFFVGALDNAHADGILDHHDLGASDGRQQVAQYLLSMKSGFVFSPDFEAGLPEAARAAFHRSPDFERGSLAFDAVYCERFLFGAG